MESFISRGFLALFGAFVLTVFCSIAFAKTFLISDRPAEPEHITAVKDSVVSHPVTYHEALLGALCLTWIKYHVWIPPKLADRLVYWESGRQQYLVHKNKDGSYDLGLGQLNSKCLACFSKDYNEGFEINYFDKIDNLAIAMQHLANMYLATDSWPDAVAAYNLGLYAYNWLIAHNKPLPDSTRQYLNFLFGQ